MSAYSTRTSSPYRPGSATGPGGAASSSSSTAGVDEAFLGATRSRTLLFLSYRSSAPRRSFGGAAFSPRASTSSSDGVDLESQGLIGGRARGGTYFDASGATTTSYPPQPTAADTSAALPPKWVDTSDEVDALLIALKPKMDRLDRLHAKHLMPGFADRSKEEMEIETVTVEITREFRRATQLIRALAASTSRDLSRMSAREGSMAQNVQTALATRVQDLSGAFRKRQANYMRRLRGLEERHALVAPGAGAARAKEEALREDMELSRAQLSKSSANSSSQAQLLLEEEAPPQLDSAQADIAARDREVDQIARSIAELAELFQDLSALVIDQGTLLDRIDYNIDNMGRDMQESVMELRQATRYQARTSRGQCILLLILLIMLALALLIIKPFWRAFSSPSAPPAPAPSTVSPFRPDGRRSW